MRNRITCRRCGRVRYRHGRGLCSTCWHHHRHLYAPAFAAKPRTPAGLTTADPGEACRFMPGTEERLVAYARRIAEGRPVFHPGDGHAPGTPLLSLASGHGGGVHPPADLERLCR